MEKDIAMILSVLVCGVAGVSLFIYIGVKIHSTVTSIQDNGLEKWAIDDTITGLKECAEKTKEFFINLLWFIAILMVLGISIALLVGLYHAVSAIPVPALCLYYLYRLDVRSSRRGK